MLKMILEKECLYKNFEIIFLNRYAPFSTSYPNKGKHVAIKKKTFETTSSALKKGMNLNYSSQ